MVRSTMNKLLLLFCIIILSGAAARSQQKSPRITTICNPLNLSYRFCLDEPSRREAADPAIILFKNQYYLFASKSGGYWHSADLVTWDFITTPGLPLEDYAPAAVVVHDTVYFMASTNGTPAKIYKTADPASGHWVVANADFPIAMTDPDLFLDTDGRLYLYYGCSDVKPIYGVQLDIKTLNPIGQPTVCFNSHPKDYGWERPGDYNDRATKPWTEGSWMTKYKGKYYLQYSTPGTEFKSYADGVYMADNPLGPFTLAPSNPVSSKPEGFINGAGHSSTFMDKYGNYWHVSTMTISVKHNFERRLGLFPIFFDKDGWLYTNTSFGDFPMKMPEKKITSPAELFPGWMLLSYKKPVKVSSALPGHPGNLAVNEDIRTYWSAKTGDKGEWLSLDLQKPCTLRAIQVDFAENGTTLLRRQPDTYYQYILEYSADGLTWKTLADKSGNKTDVPHDYIQLDKPVTARYIRITNVYIPGGTFALSGLRAFGNAAQPLPAPVKQFQAIRGKGDKCIVKLKWQHQKNALGYNIRYGVKPGKLYHTYQVLGADTVTIRSLNRFQKYYFTVDAFNTAGVKRGNIIKL